MIHSATHRQVWLIAGPMILSNLTVPLLGAVDTAVVGHLPGPHYLGAVALGAMIFSFLFWGFGFLRMGTTGVVAQALGADDVDGVRASLGRALLLAIGLGLLLLLVQQPLGGLALALIDSSEQVLAYTAEYYAIRIWSAPATLANYALLGWFLGMQNGRIPLLLMVTVNLINIILDLLFVWGLGMTVAGVAWASLIAEYAGCALGLFLAHRLLSKMDGHWQWAAVLDWSACRRLLVVNTDIFIRTLCLMFAFGFFTVQGARMGEVMLAANAVLLNFQTFMAYALDGFAHAVEALTGKAIGARDRRALVMTLKVTGLWSLAVAALFALLYAVAGSAIIQLLTDLDAVIAAAHDYLIWVIALPLVSVFSYWLDGLFIGATRSREMRNTMLFALLAVYLPVWYFSRPLDNHGLWLALTLFMVVRGVSMGWVAWRIHLDGGFINHARAAENSR